MTLVEGEGVLVITERNGIVESIQYEITEAPRFFEHIARGKRPEFIVDLVSRVCGLCGVSYVYLAVKAFEKCYNIEVDYDVDEYRRILHLAERVKSHSLHLFFMNLPAISGARSLIELTDRNPDVAKKALYIVSYTRKLMSTLGGRFHNIVNMRIGGVYSLPSKENIEKMLEETKHVLSTLNDIADIVLTLQPKLTKNIKMPQLCIKTTNEYPHHGTEVMLNDSNYTISSFYGDVVRGVHKEHSTATEYRIRGVESYITGPVARFNKAYYKMRSEVRKLLNTYGWKPPISIFEGHVARFAEIYDSLLTIREYLENYEYKSITSLKPQTLQVASSCICEYAVEAPRGVLYHKYIIGEDERVQYCVIITPTAQNLAAMEDIATQIVRGKPLSDDTVIVAKNTAIVLDPCISCAVHTLPVRLIRK
jgi:coenzyme F420-reducing hydrogenase alpha subunit